MLPLMRPREQQIKMLINRALIMRAHVIKSAITKTLMQTPVMKLLMQTPVMKLLIVRTGITSNVIIRTHIIRTLIIKTLYY